MKHHNTPTSALLAQRALIQQAIDLFQANLDLMTNSVNPDDANWVTVGIFQSAADAAQNAIERLKN